MKTQTSHSPIIIYKNIYFYLFGILIISIFEGCTILGMGIGGIIDSTKPKPFDVSVNDTIPTAIKQNTYIVCHLKDGTKIGGKYLGITHMTDHGYFNIYFFFVNSNENLLPGFGDSLVITSLFATDNQVEGEFYGFDPGKILIKVSNDSLTENIKAVSFNGLIEVTDHQGNVFKKEVLSNLDGAIPVRTVISLSCSTQEVKEVQINQVETIQVGRKRHSFLIGGAIGLPVDIIILAIGLSQMSNTDWNMSFK